MKIECSKEQAIRIKKSDKGKKYKKITYCPVLGIYYLYL